MWKRGGDGREIKREEREKKKRKNLISLGLLIVLGCGSHRGGHVNISCCCLWCIVVGGTRLGPELDLPGVVIRYLREFVTV
jgi:hypothetical protein